MTKGYRKWQADGAPALSDDGRLRTGNLGEADADGAFPLVDQEVAAGLALRHGARVDSAEVTE
ncbi:long-subunit acyl-CoA synthetase (AMP-forming) [Rhodococcus sp. 27YEA15]|uniref:hypothetical protein n=1 Tax=Rhodococcus sp. 27YEA15 TaxID=3156259 RepID=UPI003C7AD9E9